MRKNIEALVPIVRTDNDIEQIFLRDDQTITNILDVFVKADSDIHIMRAIEPNIRFGRAIRSHLSNVSKVPVCELWGSSESVKCIRIASKKQIGDAVIRYESIKN